MKSIIETVRLNLEEINKLEKIIHLSHIKQNDFNFSPAVCAQIRKLLTYKISDLSNVVLNLMTHDKSISYEKNILLGTNQYQSKRIA